MPEIVYESYRAPNLNVRLCDYVFLNLGTMELDNYLEDNKGLGTDYHHGEAEKFIQRMEEASSISERANSKMNHVKASMIGISVACLVVACLFIVGACFAGRICVRNCKIRGHRDSAMSDVSSFIYEG